MRSACSFCVSCRALSWPLNPRGTTMAPWLSGGGVVAIVMRGSASFSGLGKRIGWPVGILRGEVGASVDILQDLFGGSSRRYGQKELARKCSFGHQKCDWQVERRWVKLWPMLMWMLWSSSRRNTVADGTVENIHGATQTKSSRGKGAQTRASDETRRLMTYRCKRRRAVNGFSHNIGSTDRLSLRTT
jgi:hypothetical protein